MRVMWKNILAIGGVLVGFGMVFVILSPPKQQQKEEPSCVDQAEERARQAVEKCTHNAWSVIESCNYAADRGNEQDPSKCILAGIELLSYCENDNKEYEVHNYYR